MARPAAVLPDDEIAYLGRGGRGAPAITESLRKRGIEVDERTVGRRLEKLRGAGWPGADAHAAKLAPAKPAKSKATAGEGEDDADAGHPDELTEEELERLPAQLLAEAARATGKELRRALRAREVVSVDKLASVLERFSERLVKVRPPEKVEPVKDPTNLHARREILARWEQLREPIEVALPVVEAIEAHAARLRERAGQPAEAK